MVKQSTVECGDWRIHYSVQGQGPNLLLLHGAVPGGEGRRAFAHNMEALSRHFTVYTLDFPGWGQSSKNLIGAGQWDNPLRVGGEVVSAFVEAMGIEKTHLVGNSFGAAAALYFAMACPERVDRLVAVSPGGGIDPVSPGVLPAIMRLLSYYQGTPTLQRCRELMQDMCYDKSLITDELVAAYHQASIDPQVVANPPIRLPAGASPDPQSALCNDPRLAGLACPVLFIWGREDECQPVGALVSFAAIPDQRAVLLDKCGHWPHWEYADRFNGLVVDFLGG